MNFFTILKLKKTYSFAEYLNYTNTLAAHRETSGAEKTTDRIDATKINSIRLNRIYKTAIITPDLLSQVKQIDKPMIWLLILESWCGDGAQTAPVIARIAHQSPFISLKIILRDEHPEIMDRYLTNGSRSIPKLIFFDTGTLKELDLWGPRPKAIQDSFMKIKRENPELSHADLMKHLHLLYAKDQSVSLQLELVDLIKTIIVKQKELITL